MPSQKLIELDRKSFVSALERVAVLADQHNNVVKIETESSLESIKITADVQDVGSGSESLPVSLSGEGIQIAFNVKYVLDGLYSSRHQKFDMQINSWANMDLFCMIVMIWDFSDQIHHGLIKSNNPGKPNIL